MIKRFLFLEWRSFFRSASLGKSLVIKFFMGFIALYFMAVFLFMGFFLLDIINKIAPNQDPISAINTGIFFWIMVELLIRFFFQKLPAMHVKPLLVLNLKRKTIVNYVLGKSALSFFNFLPLFALIPFGIRLYLTGYNGGTIVLWIFAIFLISLINNFLNFIIESVFADFAASFLPIVLGLAGLFALNYFEIIHLDTLVASGMNAILESPVYFLVLLGLLVLLYYYNFKLLNAKLYLDSGLKTKVKEVNASNLEWTRTFGSIAPFLQLDLRLIWRNKRSKSSIWILVMGLLYGLFFYPNPTYHDMPWFFMFVGMFSTGIFLINFGQFIPAWDSGYYKLLMSQNIKYEDYLKSKFLLMTISVVLLFVLGIPYVYFGWKILMAHFAAAVYNIGVNSHVILFGGSFNRKKIDLSQKAAFNYQGTGLVQFLIGIPLLIIPMGLFAGFYFLIGFELACGVLLLFGIVGILFHKPLMKAITNKYIQSKYKMISAFNQDN
ncbi:DUF5687 family protein [Gaetbulibacter aestuarii]|uniref:DUF5687 family protein n=1 Tax=Gaetbulibacter aestuarii TaxID=1502358 RepID=A0ABW7MUP3_9FLAO